MTATERVAHRLDEAGVGGDRLVDVEDGGKASHDHTHCAPDDVAGNYGVHAEATDELVLVDVDDYDDLEDSSGLAALADLPPTLQVSTPHGGTHRYYRVPVTDDGRLPAAVLEDRVGARNPAPSWGEVRVANQYVVGPGSALDGCERAGCEECGTDSGGTYEIAEDEPIATVDADTLVEVLLADPSIDEPGDNRKAAPDPTLTTDDPVDVEGRIEKARNAKDGDEFAQLWDGTHPLYSEDRSRAEARLASKLAFWFQGDKQRVRELMERANPPKWAERPDDSYRESVLEAVDEVTEFYEPGTAAADGATAREELTEVPDARDPLAAETLEQRAGLGKDEDLSALSTPALAGFLWEGIRRSDDVHIRVTRGNRELWAYDDGVWNPDGRRVMRHAAREALGPSSFSANLMTELEAEALADPTAEFTLDDLGVEPGYIAVENGLLDLQAVADGEGMGAVRELRPEDYALRQLPVTYDPDADPGRWPDLVDEWAADGWGDALQEYVGYCLHTDVPIHRALMLVGNGANGKSTFLAVIRALLGDENTESMDLKTLTEEADARADFQGKLANIEDDLPASEIQDGMGIFKKLADGSPVRARRLYKDGFTFEPIGKQLYAANQVPDVDTGEEDEAFWRRWLLIQFPNHYPPHAREEGLKDELTQDHRLSGALNWAVEGWNRLMEQGSFTNEEAYADDKRRRWQSWGDSVDEFISKCTQTDEDADRIPTGDVYKRYKAWCHRNDKDLAAQQALTNALKTEDVGYASSIRIDGKVERGYKKLGFTDDVPELNDRGDADGQQRLG